MPGFKCTVDVLIEDFNSIKSVNFAFIVSVSCDTSEVLTSVRFKLEGSKCSMSRSCAGIDDYKLDFETALLALPFGSEKLNATVVKKSINLHLPDYLFPDWDPDSPMLSLPCSQLDGDWKTGGAIKTTGVSAPMHYHRKVYSRLPYQRASAGTSSTDVASSASMTTEEAALLWKESIFHHHYARAHSKDSNIHQKLAADILDICGVPVSVFCGHCKHGLVSSVTGASQPELELQCARRLPSGVFDLMMYSFMCSEEQSALSTSDVAVPRDTVLSGILSIALHPQHFATEASTTAAGAGETAPDSAPCSVQMQCKVHNSCLDMILGNAAAAGNNVNLMGVPARDINDHLKVSGSLLNIDTCRVLCACCGAYVGDGVFDVAQDGGAGCNSPYCRPPAVPDVPAVLQSPNTDQSNADPEHATISLGDLSSIRLLGSSVGLVFTPQQAVSEQCSLMLSAEKMVARLLYKLSAVSGLAHYFLYPEALHLGTGVRAGTRQGEQGPEVGIYVKLLTKDYQLSMPAVETAELDSALRIEYCVYDLKRVSPHMRRGQLRMERRRLPWVESEASVPSPGSDAAPPRLPREALHIPLCHADIQEVADVLQSRFTAFNSTDGSAPGSSNCANALLLV